MTALIQIRRDTVANWAADPTLNAGEFGYETDTGNMKIGTGAAWSSTAYLDFSMPARVANSDLNLNTTPGRYYLADMLAATNIPTGLIAPITLDGQASLWVQTFKNGPPATLTNIVQMMFSEGAGTTANPSKSWARSYDAGAAAWRDWYPLSSWGVDATNGVELKAATIEAKGTLAVGGISTLTGAVNVAGAVSVVGVLSVGDGTPAAPSITNTGDTDTGLSFATANTIVLSTAGAAAVTVGPTGGVTIAASRCRCSCCCLESSSHIHAHKNCAATDPFSIRGISSCGRRSQLRDAAAVHVEDARHATSHRKTSRNCHASRWSNCDCRCACGT